MARYIGKRIVPKHCGYWDNTKEYEMESVVYDRASGNSYISRKAVPVGTDISQTEYWALCSDFNMQMDLLEKHFTATEQRIKADNDETEQAIRQDKDQTEQTDTLNKSDQTVTTDDKNQPVQNNTLNQTIQRDPSDQKKQTNVTVAESKHQQAHDRIRQESDNSASRLKSEADRAVSEADQKSEAELDEIRRKVNRAKQRRDKFIQTDTNDASDSQVYFQV